MPAPLIRLPDDVTGYSLGYAHNNFAIVVPEPTTNLIVNPSFENASNWAYGWTPSGTIGWQASLDYASRGRVSAYQAGVNGTLMTNPSVTLLSDTPHTFSLDVRGREGGTVTVSAERVGEPVHTMVARYTGRWQRVSLTFHTSAAGVGGFVFRITTDAPVYVDGVQLEAKPYETTYCDGDVMGYGIVQNEYRWDTQAHASVSYRSHLTRHGGRLTPLGLAEKVHLVSVQGLGAPPVQMATSQLYDGTSYVTQAQDRSREVTMIFALYGESPRDLRRLRRQIIDLFSDSPSHLPQPVRIVLYPNNANDDPDGQPLILTAHYLDGLEGMRTSHYSERVAIRLQSVNAYFSEQYSEVMPFTIPTPANVGQVMYRDPQGAWRSVTPNNVSFEDFSPLPGAQPTGNIGSMAFLGETLVFGGRFVNLEGVAAYDYLVAYNPATNTKSIVGDGVNNFVFGLEKGQGTHQGKLFISGDFTANASGARTARRYAVHPGGLITTPLLFPAVGIANGSISGFAFHRNGRVYVAGGFTQLSDGTNVPGLAYADATTLSLGALNIRAETTVTNGVWNCAVAGPDDLIYFGGLDGVQVEGELVGPVISYEPSTGLVRPMGQRLNGTNVLGLTFGTDGYLYAVGRVFTANLATGQTTNYIARYNGFDWEVLPPISGGTPGGYAWYELEGAMGVARIGSTLHIVGGFRLPARLDQEVSSTTTYGYGRFVGNKMLVGDIIIPDYGVGSVAASDGDALAFGLYAGNPDNGSHPWVKPTDMTAHFPLTMSVDMDDAAEWDLYVVGPCILDSFTNFTTNANVFFAPLTVQTGEYARISLRGNRIEARSSRGVLITSNYLYSSDVPGRLSLVPGNNNLQVAMHAYNTSTTKVSLGVRRRIRSFDYAE